jgi:hypothetical protein
MIQLDSNIRVRVAPQFSDDMVQLCEDNGVPCYYVTAEENAKVWELHIDGAEVGTVASLLQALAELA